eukprot:CAMPEP_0113566666 /NCGR_PEP_ID=MMETSP0015_2-20120614/22850_1 /TAXON_ID=2838 /ORGANISM="Odontella" /LENGTH=94 /DNA_ID=CAMNT_0000468981 /DNA_START=23 /DNA_END=304 /DNA_ORIENTATION=+ /assembly_acc=CAM_ASM_000160
MVEDSRSVIGRESCGRVMHVYFISVLAAIMFAAAAKAFTAAPRSVVSRSGGRHIARFMSTDDTDSSVVDICREKISAALETTDVKVTGAYDDPN